ncbi:tetratricopeptide repeat protein [Bergeriella denitrificans]|uniref:Predicted O-linked N-acetylglucosamine transferase, SPINDLY family n=1 Tax=Bergeriella denitrificans TaxID=494 RepID=A0A378UE37_BERDE|nr:tetratricopeptide repeat protein [Bergeriella denitrificans]STZ75636.1 Predicted O-linked N-acetylglucosamine transferase, SPINDLY family [Bergeriella denitrificans]
MARAPAHLQRFQQRQKAQSQQQQLDEIGKAFKWLMAQGRPQEALLLVRRALQIAPKSAAAWSDAATAALLSERYEESIRYAREGVKIDPMRMNFYDALSHAYGALGDWVSCGIAGRAALQLRDQKFGSGELPALPAAPKKPDGKKIIAFSLFGSSSEYGEPAVLNAEICADIYPGWVCRFYVDGSVPEQVSGRLKKHGAEVVEVDAAAQAWPGTMWRFLAMDDADAAYILFRDADSVISQREAAAVAAWLQSGKLFHTMRDSGSHTELVLAGLWGAAAGAVPDMRGKIEAYLRGKVESEHFADQYFLRSCVWPYVKQSLCAHDRLFGFGGAADFPDNTGFDYAVSHVGCNEGNALAEAAVDYPDGTEVVWKLYSSIAPLLNSDLSDNTLPQERLVCEYTAKISGGKCAARIPRRYARGFADGRSRLTITQKTLS